MMPVVVLVVERNGASTPPSPTSFIDSIDGVLSTSVMIYGLLAIFLLSLLFVPDANGLSPTYNLRRGRHIRARLDGDPIDADAEVAPNGSEPRNCDREEEEDDVGAHDPILADKRSISLSNLFFPGAAATSGTTRQTKRRANGHSKKSINNNLFRSSGDADKEANGPISKSHKNDDINKRHNKHGTDDKHKGPKIWDQWGKWSSCSVTCGIGKITRWRHCVSGGCAAGEKEAQIKTCTMPAC